MTGTRVKSAWETLHRVFSGADLGADLSRRSNHERFALPYSFKPQLSVLEAVVAATAAFLQILVGSLLFAFWGTYSLIFCQHINNIFLRAITALALVLVFLILLPALLIGIRIVGRSLARRLYPNVAPKKKPFR